MSDIRTMNLNDNGDGMVSLDNPSTTFVQENEFEKNISQSKDTTTMDSTPISELMGGGAPAPDMMGPPMMSAEPRMQSVLSAAPQMHVPEASEHSKGNKVKPKSKNFMNLTDDQLFALIAGICAAAAVSRPVQEKLASTVPKFLSENGSRSAVGLASTGLVAAVIFYIAKTYVVKN